MPDARKEEPIAGTEQGGGFSGEMLFGRRNEPKVAKCPVDWRLTGPNSPFLCLLTSERGPFRALKLGQGENPVCRITEKVCTFG